MKSSWKFFTVAFVLREFLRTLHWCIVLKMLTLPFRSNCSRNTTHKTMACGIHPRIIDEAHGYSLCVTKPSIVEVVATKTVTKLGPLDV